MAETQRGQCHASTLANSVAAVYELVCALAPADDVEADHRRHVMRWLESTDDVYRRVKPATPPRHLVSYVVPVDPTDCSVLLVDHVNAGLWTDVSLWFLIERSRDHPLTPDCREFREVRWWTPADLRAADPARFDPHLTRFCATIWQGGLSELR
jgi:8-oxo-dGTP diphosphatase